MVFSIDSDTLDAAFPGRRVGDGPFGGRGPSRRGHCMIRIHSSDQLRWRVGVDARVIAGAKEFPGWWGLIFFAGAWRCSFSGSASPTCCRIAAALVSQSCFANEGGPRSHCRSDAPLGLLLA